MSANGKVRIKHTEDVSSVYFVPDGSLDDQVRLMETTTFVGHQSKERAEDYARERHVEAFYEWQGGLNEGLPGNKPGRD